MGEQQSVNLSLARWSLKEIRSGQLWLVVLAFVLIITSVFALSALAERMAQVIVTQGKDALMADTVFVSANPVPELLLKLVNSAESKTLSKKPSANAIQTSEMTRFSTMLFGDQSMKLVFVKAVDDAFPLKGHLVVSDGVTEHSHVAAGEVWLDQQLFSDLGLKIGDTVFIGDLKRKVTGKILEEPGLSFNPFRQMPTVFIHQSDVPATGAVQLGSRVEYRLFINAPNNVITQLKQQVTLTPSDQWRDVNQSTRTTDIFAKAQRYLSLVVMITVLIAMITLLFTCQNYVASRKKIVAMLKSLGASQRWIRRWLVIQMALLMAISLVIGLPLGYLLEQLLHIPLSGLLPSPLPALGFRPLNITLLSCLLVAIPGFGVSLYQLIHVQAASVLQDEGTRSRFAALRWGLFLIPCMGLAVFFGENMMIWLVLGGIVVMLAITAGGGLLLLRLVQHLPLTPPFVLALRRIRRTPLMTGIQVSALALSLMLFSVLWIVRADLLTDWSGIFPKDAPDVFALNISTDDKANYIAQLEKMHLQHSPLFPIARGRLFKINGIDAKTYAGGENVSDIFRREVNFTWADHLPEYNQVLNGAWTTSQGVSVESKVAEALKIHVGDELTFMIDNQSISATVNAIRQVEWRDMKPNFYFILTPDLSVKLSATWLMSFRLGNNAATQLSTLARQYPTVSLIDLRKMTMKIQELLSQIVGAISILTGVSLCAGLLLIYTLLRLSMNQRQSEMKLYRTLGMSHRQLRLTIWAEFGLIALAAGLVSGVGADALVAVLVTYGFDLTAHPHYIVWVLQPIVALLMVMFIVVRLFHHLDQKHQSINSLNLE